MMNLLCSWLQSRPGSYFFNGLGPGPGPGPGNFFPAAPVPVAVFNYDDFITNEFGLISLIFDIYSFYFRLCRLSLRYVLFCITLY